MQGLILFANDWERINAEPHFTTTNTSFLHMARLLKSMGVKNHLFFLALIDQRLKEIDPFAPNLSQEEIAMVAQECYMNPWYFFREIARAPGEAGAPPRMLEANRGNITLFWCFFNHVMTMLIQIRQTGKSFNSDVLNSALLQIWCRKTSINLLTLNEKVRRNNIARIKKIMDVFPRFLDLRTAKDADNSEMITIKAHENNLFTHLPRADEDAANTAGRGLTSPVFFCDEVPFQANIHKALPAALAAGGKAVDLARDAGQPFGTILTTTAGKKDTKEGAFTYKILSDMAEWTDSFFDAKNEAHLYELIKGASRDGNVRVNITLNHTQLGKSDEWLKGKISEALVSGDDADRDFFNRWTSGTVSNPLSPAQLERIAASERPSVFDQHSEIGGFTTKWFIPEHEIEARMSSEPTIILFDTSDASGGDDISMRVTNLRTGIPYAVARINNSNIITFSNWVASWLTRWDKTTMLIERRSTGIAVLDMLLLILPEQGIDPFKRLFNRVVNDPDEHKEAWKIVQEPLGRRPSDFYTMQKKHFGFATSGSGLTSRSSLYGQVLNAAANTVGHLVYDRTTISQIMSLITKDGRVNHPAGEHDDMVLSWLFEHWFMTKATNLRFYGIDSTTILSEVRTAEVQSPVDRLRALQQNQLRNRARVLSDAIKEADDDAMARIHEQELRVIYTRIIARDNERLSVDDMINDLREQRIRRRIHKLNATDRTAQDTEHKHKLMNRERKHAAYHFRPQQGNMYSSTRFF